MGSVSPYHRRREGYLYLETVPKSKTPTPKEKGDFLCPMLDIVPFLFLSQVQDDEQGSSFDAVHLAIGNVAT